MRNRQGGVSEPSPAFGHLPRRERIAYASKGRRESLMDGSESPSPPQGEMLRSDRGGLLGLMPLLLLLLLAGCTSSRPPRPVPEDLPALTRMVYEGVEDVLRAAVDGEGPVVLSRASRIDTVVLDPANRRLDVRFNRAFAETAFRVADTTALYAAVTARLGRPFLGYALSLQALGRPLTALIPNALRPDPATYDATRIPAPPADEPLVTNLDAPWHPSAGLFGRHLALWPSHGWYYEPKLDRWEWQRARLFETVEDLLPMSFTLPFLVPMLENAGAHVFLPRERDTQVHEALVDADGSAAQGYVEVGAWQDGPEPGFGVGSPPYGPGENPFRMGGYRVTETAPDGNAEVRWTPDIPEDGAYAVYVAYASLPDGIPDARYTVYHAGGSTTFSVDQRKGGGTWIYLGTFVFKTGSTAGQGRVVLTNQSATSGRVTADAVRFGGGMGVIARGGKTSGRPRFAEGARYYLQYAGFPDTLVYNVTETLDDYRDDYQSRGEWVNYLRGAPFGPNKDRTTAGLNIPIDLSLAFHTDAGVTRNDTTVGTLLIYSSDGADETTDFPDGLSRFANRDFADLLQTQIIDDLRARWDPAWTRRGLWDRDYSEAFRPNVPAALLELLSHQNFLDMKFAQDPRFRFDVSRAIYKAMLRFLAFQYGRPAVVQPLPVSHFQAVLSGPRAAVLTWRPVEDVLEASAVPTHYIVYTRIGDRGFDNGRLVVAPRLTVEDLAEGIVYSFRVTAVNVGGESFPSETLAVSRTPGAAATVLVVNGFDRVAPPATLEAGPYLGFASFWDEGVPWGYDDHYIGRQYDFQAGSPWLDDDAPGHGASYGDYETRRVAGNTFDFPFIHGQSIRAAGYSFVSASDEAVMDGQIDLRAYPVVDLILGEERTTDWPKPTREKAFEAFPLDLQAALRRYAEAGGRLFVSGAYVGTDLLEGKPEDHPDRAFAREVLGFTFRTNHAVRQGDVFPVSTSVLPFSSSFSFNTTLNPKIYAAEAPDAIEAADSTGRTVLRYAENNTSAGVATASGRRVVVFGFPFETITTQPARDDVMRAVLMFLLDPKTDTK